MLQKTVNYRSTAFMRLWYVRTTVLFYLNEYGPKIVNNKYSLMYNYIRKKKFKSKHFGWDSGTLSFLPLWFAVLPRYSTTVTYCLRKHSPACEAQGKKANGSWNAVCVYLPNPAFPDMELDKEKRCPFISTKDTFFHWAGPGRTNQEKCITVRVQAGTKWRYSQFN